MREPPQPGDRIIVLYRGDESKYGMTAVLATVGAVTAESGDLHLWAGAVGCPVLCRRLDEEGIEWARATPAQAAMWELHHGWHEIVNELLAARRLAGTAE